MDPNTQNTSEQLQYADTTDAIQQQQTPRILQGGSKETPGKFQGCFKDPTRIL